LKVANKALKFIPNHASIYFNVANILGKKGKYEEAEIQFKQAISKDPTAPMIYANLGISRMREREQFMPNGPSCFIDIRENT